MNAATGLDRVEVLIVNYNAGPWLGRCVETLIADGGNELLIHVVDNASSDNSLALLPQSKQIHIERNDRNLGFAGAIERYRPALSRDYLLVLNPDSMIDQDDLVRLVEELDRHPRAGLVSGKVLSETGLEQRASRRQLPTPKRILAELRSSDQSDQARIDLTHTPAPSESIEIEAVSGACMLVRRTALEAVGGFDADYPLHFEDLDLFARLQNAGWTIRWCADVQIVHVGGASSNSRPLAVHWAKHRGLWRYLNKHCKPVWPQWQRPIWALLVVLHAAIMAPLVWLRRRPPST